MFQCYFSLLLHPFQPFGSQSWHLKTARWSGVPQTPSDGWVVVFISLWQLGPGGSSRLGLYTNPASASRTAWMAWSKASHKRLVFVHSLSCKADLIIATGSVKLVAKKLVVKKQVWESTLLSATQASHAVNYSSFVPHSTWFKGKEVVSQNLDECPIGSWIFANSHINVSFSLIAWAHH